MHPSQTLIIEDFFYWYMGGIKNSSHKESECFIVNHYCLFFSSIGAFFIRIPESIRQRNV
jgi:hypothetical protein